MGKSYKNFWSLNVDEAVVIGILRECTFRNIEVLMPANAQMKDVDLVLMNMVNGESLKIQVKGSRAYEPKRGEVIKFKNGSGGWFRFKKDVINKSTADFFIFLVYVFEEDKKIGRRIISPHTVTISTKKLKLLCKKHKKVGKGDVYNFFIWVDPIKNKSFEFRNETYDISEYLDENGFSELNRLLR